MTTPEFRAFDPNTLDSRVFLFLVAQEPHCDNTDQEADDHYQNARGEEGIELRRNAQRFFLHDTL